ncbi:MAG: YheU family protein [Oligoflexus sp.]
MEIPYKKLNPETLERLVESFVNREGTDYGHQSWTIEEKVQQVIQQIQKGRAIITYDPDTETCNILTVDQNYPR